MTTDKEDTPRDDTSEQPLGFAEFLRSIGVEIPPPRPEGSIPTERLQAWTAALEAKRAFRKLLPFGSNRADGDTEKLVALMGLLADATIANGPPERLAVMRRMYDAAFSGVSSGGRGAETTLRLLSIARGARQRARSDGTKSAVIGLRESLAADVAPELATIDEARLEASLSTRGEYALAATWIVLARWGDAAYPVGDETERDAIHRVADRLNVFVRSLRE